MTIGKITHHLRKLCHVWGHLPDQVLVKLISDSEYFIIRTILQKFKIRHPKKKSKQKMKLIFDFRQLNYFLPAANNNEILSGPKNKIKIM